MNITLRSYKPADFETLHEIDQVCYEAEIAYVAEDGAVSASEKAGA